MQTLRACPSCHRHVRGGEEPCPFCARHGALVFVGVAVIAAVAACGGPQPTQGTVVLPPSTVTQTGPTTSSTTRAVTPRQSPSAQDAPSRPEPPVYPMYGGPPPEAGDRVV